ncbi:unnamed protein product [Peronospora destructor]|uniref:Reverse transcriptase n=1 Tax=Peronospora destructor TaxID=86335 RepID=A0AAV0TRJ3_9STRA|nr:unnamed protein product [Peronospora destructor]
MDAVRTRHDEAFKVIERKVAASPGTHADRVELRVNQTVPSLPGPALRPDLQVYNHSKRTVSVVDLAVAFEEQATDDPRTSSLAWIAELKRTKYDYVKRHLDRQGWTVHLSALVYGSLGAVADGNLAVYTKHLGLLNRRIWNMHCSMHRARQRPGHSRPASRDNQMTETGGTPSHNGLR